MAENSLKVLQFYQLYGLRQRIWLGVAKMRGLTETFPIIYLSIRIVSIEIASIGIASIEIALIGIALIGITLIGIASIGIASIEIA